MRRSLLGAWPWLLLFAAALGLGVLAGGSRADDSPLPSLRNPGPQGARVLQTWLKETGGNAEPLDQPLTSIPEGVEVLVIAAPIARAVSEDEVHALERFVTAGGTLLYFSPRPTKTQPALAEWLQLSDSKTQLPGDTSTDLGDIGGATVSVDVARGLLAGVKQLRVSADLGLEVEGGATAIAQKMLWWKSLGKGEIWIAAGPDLLENRRLELLDNPQLWANLRSRRVAFDELHFVPAAPIAWSANLWASFGQLVFVGLVFVAVRGRRLGPGRPTLVREHRSILEYVRSMGGLMRRSQVEGPLQLQLRARLRRLMHERLGIALSLSADEASRLLAQHTALAPDAYSRLDARLQGHPSDFARVAAEAARLEDAIVGRRAGGVNFPGEGRVRTP